MSEPVCSSMLVVIGYLVTETAFRKGRKYFLISGLLLVAIFAVFYSFSFSFENIGAAATCLSSEVPWK